ncbi:MAG: cation:proton antiporter [Oscillospiraceae bacterium]
MSILWYISLMLVGGLCFGRLAKLVKLPNVTGYLIAGLILGPYVLKLLPMGIVSQLDIVADVALGFIAFSVGSEFKLSYIKKVGATPIVIATLEALFAVVFVVGGMLACGQDLAFSLVIGAIAAATAPAATVMVIKQYQAKGQVTDTLLTVVALDDAAALMLFGIATAVAGQITSSADTSMLSAILQPVYEILGSLVVGAIIGVLLSFPLRFFKKQGNRLSIIIATVFLTISLAQLLHLSALLTCMAMGCMFVNLSSQAENVMKISDSFTPPILMLFFVLSGAELDITVLPTIGLIGIVYVVVRVLGKYVGAYMGAKIMKAPKNVQKFLGPALIPQAGVAIGLSLIATTVVPQFGQQIRAIILCGTFIYEMIGPVITKISLQKAGEIQTAK